MANCRSIQVRAVGPAKRKSGSATSDSIAKSPTTQPRQTRWPSTKSRPSAEFQIRTASEDAAGAVRLMATKCARSRLRVRSGETLSVTIDPQMIAVSTAPARANTALVGDGMPLHAAETTLAR